MNRSSFASMLLLALCGFVNVQPANADFRFLVTSGGVGSIITDGAASDTGLSAGANGWIQYGNTMIPNFQLQTSNNTAQPPFNLAPGANSAIDLNNTTIAATSGGSLTLVLQMSGITSGANGPLSLFSQVGGTLMGNGTVTFQTFANGANSVPITAADVGNNSNLAGSTGAVAVPVVPGGSVAASWNLLGNPLSATFGPGAFSATGSGSFTAGSSYSLFLMVTVNFGTGGGSVTFDHLGGAVVPEPASVLSALFGVPALGYWLRRRQTAVLAA